MSMSWLNKRRTRCKIKCVQYQSQTPGPKIQSMLPHNAVHLADSKKEVPRTGVGALKWWEQLAIQNKGHTHEPALNRLSLRVWEL